MTVRQLWIRSALWTAPAAVAAVVKVPFAVVIGLAIIAVLSAMVRVGRVVLGERRSARAPRLFDAAARTRTRPDPKPPRDVERMATMVSARSRSAGGVHHWMRPLMRDLALARLDPGTIPASWDVPDVDPLTWASIPDPLRSLIAPDRPTPPDPSAPGISLAEVRTLVDQLETL